MFDVRCSMFDVRYSMFVVFLFRRPQSSSPSRSAGASERRGAKLLRALSRSAKFPQAGCGISFGEPDTSCIGQKRTVKKRRCGELQGGIEEELAKRGGDQIRAAHHLGDLHSGVIHRARELIARQVVFSPNEEVSEIDAGNLLLRTEAAVREADCLPVRNAKTPAYPSVRSPGGS